MRAKANYCSNADLLAEIMKWKEGGCGKMPDSLGAMLIMITKKILTKGCWRSYSENWKDEWESESLLTLCKYLKNFDIKKSSNAFAFVSTIIHNAIRHGITKEKKRLKALEDYKLSASAEIFDVSPSDSGAYQRIVDAAAVFNLAGAKQQDPPPSADEKKKKPAPMEKFF
jgi:DNA-directed RNA polymerase specialized sigma24 family protein